MCSKLLSFILVWIQYKKLNKIFKEIKLARATQIVIKRTPKHY